MRLTCYLGFLFVSSAVLLPAALAQNSNSPGSRLYYFVQESRGSADAAAQRALENLAARRHLSLEDLQLQRRTELGSGVGTVFIYLQRMNGLAVENGFVRIFVSNAGSVFASADLADSLLPGLSQAKLVAGDAKTLIRNSAAYSHFVQWSDPELVIYFSPETEKGYQDPRTAWTFRGGDAGFQKESRRFFVDAITGELLLARNEIFDVDISGHVQGKATPGLLPDTSYNLPVNVSLISAQVKKGTTVVYTDNAGNFVMPNSGSTAVTLESSLVGPWVTVVNAQGNGLTQQLNVTPPGPANFSLNANPQAFDTAQLNGFLHTTATHDFYKLRQPDFDGIDLSLTCNVNIVNACNANFNMGNLTINFFIAASSCVNTAYSTVINHEYGHFIVNRLGLSQGAFGEGFGDSIAALMHDTPIIAQDFQGPGTYLRKLDDPNISFPCSDPDPHYCGMVLAGIWWDLRQSLGLEETRQLFTDWSQITSGVLGSNGADVMTLGEVLLVADASQASAVCAAFSAHGISCTDCNNNGVIDALEIAGDESKDCNRNSILDSCEIASGALSDCNQNGIPDSCEQGVLFQWTRSVGGSLIDDVSDLVVDAQGGIYLVGNFSGTVDFNPGPGMDVGTSMGSNDIYVSHYNSDGSYAWTRYFGGSEQDKGKGIALDWNGEIYVTGNFQGTVDFNPSSGIDLHTSNGGTDVFLLKLQSDGSFVWAKTFGSTVQSPSVTDTGNGLVVDANNTVTIVGSFQSSMDFDPSANEDVHVALGGNDVFLAQFASDGSYRWAATFGGIGGDAGSAITADSAGHLFVTGTFQNNVDFNPADSEDQHASVGVTDVFVARFTDNGLYQGALTFGGYLAFMSSSAISATTSGDLYVAGSFSGIADFNPGSEEEFLIGGSGSGFVIALKTDGSYRWTRVIQGLGYSTVSANDLAVYGNQVVIAGDFTGTIDFNPSDGFDVRASLSSDAFFTQLNGDGYYAWTQTINGTSIDVGRTVAPSPSGNLYLGGTFSLNTDLDPTASEDFQNSVGLSDAFVSRVQAITPNFFADCNGNGSYDGCDIANGTSADQNGNGIPDECESSCPWDLDHSGSISGADLGIFFGIWNIPVEVDADFDGDGIVTGADLGALLAHWGQCP